jgi:hypothetical protein
MLDLIVSNHDIGPLFWEVALCFYSRNHRSADLDAVFCTPCTEISLGSITGTHPEPQHGNSNCLA